MKTALYIDGYNLYYGLIKKSPFKWLDLHGLCSEIVKVQNPQSEIQSIKYFTAPIITKFSEHKEMAQQSQNYYHKALCAHSKGCIEIINGYFDVGINTPVIYQKPIDLSDRVKTWKLEEKQTDVNIALEMYRDASLGGVDQQILISSDSDLVPALNYIKGDFENIVLGLILPRNNQNRRRNNALSDCVNWTRRYISEGELKKHQLPDMVPTNKKPVYKPKYW